MTDRSKVVLPEPADIEELFKELAAARIDAVLIGGLAMLRHVQGRNTEDIDLIVPAEAFGALARLELIDRTTDSARGRFRSIRVDALFSEHPVFGLVARAHAEVVALRDAETSQDAPLRIRCATPLGLAILKLYALPNLYRLGQLDRAALYETDLLALRQQAGVDLGASLRILEAHLGAGDRAELARIVEEIESRAARMVRSAERATEADRAGECGEPA